MGEKEKQDQQTEEEETETEKQEEETQEKETEEQEEELSAEELRVQLAKTKSDLRAANKEAKDRRLKLEQLEKEKKDREEAELSEVEKLKKQAAEQEAELEKARKEARELKLEGELGKTVRELKLSFASEKARETALRLLDLEEIGEDFSGLEDAIKALAKDHGYLFGKADPNQFINDGSKKARASSATVTRQTVEAKKRRVSPL